MGKSILSYRSNISISVFHGVKKGRFFQLIKHNIQSSPLNCVGLYINQFATDAAAYLGGGEKVESVMEDKTNIYLYSGLSSPHPNILQLENTNPGCCSCPPAMLSLYSFLTQLLFSFTLHEIFLLVQWCY